MRLVDEKNRITDDRIRLKVIGYAMLPTRKSMKTPDIGNAFGLPYRGRSKVAETFDILINKKLIENLSEGDTARIYFIRNRKGLENLYHQILWRNV